MIRDPCFQHSSEKCTYLMDWNLGAEGANSKWSASQTLEKLSRALSLKPRWGVSSWPVKCSFPVHPCAECHYLVFKESFRKSNN